MNFVVQKLGLGVRRRENARDGGAHVKPAVQDSKTRQCSPDAPHSAQRKVAQDANQPPPPCPCSRDTPHSGQRKVAHNASTRTAHKMRNGPADGRRASPGPG